MEMEMLTNPSSVCLLLFIYGENILISLRRGKKIIYKGYILIS